MENLTFGTDGIRGIYGKTLTDGDAFRLGAALGSSGDVLIGSDNRPSSPSLVSALAAGVARAGGRAVYTSLITTPALYYCLTRREETYAVMVTASHNPPSHNGLKVFSRRGKLSEEERDRVTEEMASCTYAPSYAAVRGDPSILSLYEEFILSFAGDLSGVKVAVDFAGGALFAFKELLKKTGATVFPLNDRRNGDRINEEAGALFPSVTARAVKEVSADMGFAADGDGDRIAAVNKGGEILDGDKILYLLACKMKEEGTLRKNTIALTVMTNSGVLESLEKKGIRALSCAVGDSAVTKAMETEKLSLGGEQSGHIVLGDYLMTGDALLVGTALMKMIKQEGGLPDLSGLKVYPQILLNVPVRDKKAALTNEVREAAEKIKESFGVGRVLVRESGTENLVRVMTEHPSRERAEEAASALAELIRKGGLR